MKIRQKNKTLIGYRMKFLFWLMNFKILSGEISEANFYETARSLDKNFNRIYIFGSKINPIPET